MLNPEFVVGLIAGEQLPFQRSSIANFIFVMRIEIRCWFAGRFQPFARLSYSSTWIRGSVATPVGPVQYGPGIDLLSRTSRSSPPDLFCCPRSPPPHFSFSPLASLSRPNLLARFHGEILICPAFKIQRSVMTSVSTLATPCIAKPPSHRVSRGSPPP
jgi:hypothetical protein